MILHWRCIEAILNFLRWGSKESKILKLIPRSFDDVIQINVSRQASHEADSIIQGAVRRLEQDGLDLSKLSTMEAAKLEKLLAESVTAELNGMARSPGYQWGYNSGKLFVKGEVGHFSFQQELAISGIAKSVLAGAGTVAGYHYGWENNKFNRIHSCVGSFCLEIKENTSSNQQTKGISID